MANGLVQLYLMIKAYLSTGRVWWHMPLALTMAYSLFERERLLNFALFDSYPNPLPGLKRRCNDPMLGKAGLFALYILYMKRETERRKVGAEHC